MDNQKFDKNQQAFDQDDFDVITGKIIDSKPPKERRFLKALQKRIARRFMKTMEKAQDFLTDDDKIEPFLMNVERKFKSIPKVGKSLAYIPQLALLVRSYAKGEYRELSKTQIVAIIAALLYFVNPFDVIPDFIKGVGILDDVLVAAAITRWCEDDIKKYMNWLKDKRGAWD